MAIGDSHSTRLLFCGAVTLLAIVTFKDPVWGGETGALRPNIVLFMADDLGEEVLGAYGGESFETPNLDALAANGTRFTQCYSTPKCSPSRATILTGRYTLRYPHEWGHLPPDEVTFGNILRDAGYATAAAGKWQMSLLQEAPLRPREEGFNRYSFWAWHEGPRYYDPLIWQDGKLVNEAVAERYGPDVYADFLISHMKRNRGKHQRFLAYFPMTLPHFAKTGGSFKEPKGPDGEYQSYGDLVTQMDRIVGRLVDLLERLGLRDRTLVLFTSDNGTPRGVTVRADGREVRGGKGKHTNAGTHVPLIASWPGYVPKGAVNDALIDLSDFFPTLAELTGASMPEERIIDGVSFLPQLLGSDARHRDWIYTRWQGREWVRNHEWKLYGDGTLYHVAADVKEESPIEADQADQEAEIVRRELRQAFKELRRRRGKGARRDD